MFVSQTIFPQCKDKARNGKTLTKDDENFVTKKNVYIQYGWGVPQS